MPHQTRSLEDWLTHISHQHAAEIVMGLDRVRAVWEKMGKPQAPINITVAGTNGKGSTCAMLEAILNIAGFKTGFYSSPHLLHFNERVRIDRKSATDEELVAAFAAVEEARFTCSPAVPLTYFEYVTLAAFWIFARENLDVAILEVGMGGRLDAVNVIDADVSIVVSIDLDHQAYLGDTIEKIGLEKAHVYRSGKPAIFADVNPPQSLLAHAEEIGADLRLLNRDYRFSKMEGQWQYLGRDAARHSLPYPALRGGYQLKNAAAALTALEVLREQLPVSQNHIKRGLLEVEWPGRMQVLPGRPTVVLDVAHNPHAARALQDALGTMGFFENTIAVFGMLKDKDIDDVIDIIKGRIDFWCIAGLELTAGARGASSALMSEKLMAHGLEGKFSQHVDIASAFAAARGRAGQNDRILVFGSFYTVADVLASIKSPH
ncbi:MAG: bifunctional tetrahydrofolate synthase/dihydrofolate synthase [Betaproteobacteria bacterium]